MGWGLSRQEVEWLTIPEKICNYLTSGSEITDTVYKASPPASANHMI